MSPEDYQHAREVILTKIEEQKRIADNLRTSEPAFFNSLPREVVQRFLHVDREITRLRQANLTVAFVGGFSAGKSSLVNAFLGRYLLPEATEVTTAVPTFVRSTSGDERVELSFLGAAEVNRLEELYRNELSTLFEKPDIRTAPFQELIEQLRPLTSEGRGKSLLDYFERFMHERKSREIPDRGLRRECSLTEMQRIVRDETESMFLDRVEVFIQSSQLPADVHLVDLPGVSVPNPRHRELTYRFVKQDAHAVVFVLLATRLFDKDEQDILSRIRAGETSISKRTFWVLNRWDSLSVRQQEEAIASFRATMEEYSITNYVHFATNASRSRNEYCSRPSAMPLESDGFLWRGERAGNGKREVATHGILREVAREVAGNRWVGTDLPRRPPMRTSTSLAD